ncbi:MAG TPA: DUF4011 domain-containing protein [Xanthobacteraceae bacterium]|nr:DUF4011 domain-containing protein [Xanthobacteraceae bacterium]
MADGGTESQGYQRLYDDLRKKLLDLSRRNPMLNYKHRAGSRRQLRIVNTNLEGVFAALTEQQRDLPFIPLPEPDDIPDDELTDGFKAALGHAKSTDLDYLTRLTALDAVARQDDASLARLDRWLRDRVREELELPPRPNRREFNLVEHARKKHIEPSYELPLSATADANVVRHLQSMFFADELDSRLARIAADARLSEQETGLSTLFIAFGFLRWYESNDSDIANFAPLILLPVQIAKQLQGRKAIYSIKAGADTPEINLSLREFLSRESPDVSRYLPDFNEESDSVGSYFEKVQDAINGLKRWRIERNLTLGHFAFGRLAMYEDLSPDNWSESPVRHPVLESLLRGSDTESGGALLFATDYDLDDEFIENAAPILISDADASQHSAIVDVMKGKNLVIEGPPGTGKSQTITNIIANAVYAGKTVLFLADKLAALEVVKDRLDAVGLGEFCLELHSDKAHPKPIVESLKQRYELARHTGPEPNWRDELQRLRSARGRVRDYLSALHEREEHDDRTPFELMWSAIAARRELPQEFEVVRRVDLNSVFSKGWAEIEQCKEALKLYASAAHDYGLRHGPFGEAVWSRAGFSSVSDDPIAIADAIRDTYHSASVLNELLATTSSSLTLEMPTSTDGIEAWAAAVERLPTITEDGLLPCLGGFTPTDIEAAAELALERLELATHPVMETLTGDPEAIAQLARQVQNAALLELSPAEIVESASRMESSRKSLIESIEVFMPLIAAFRPQSEPDLSVASAMATVVRFVNSIPQELDPYLWFEGRGCEAVLADGCRRLRDLRERDRTLRARVGLDATAQWPPVDHLRTAYEAYSATGLRRIGVWITGKNRRAARVLRELGDPKVSADDLEAIMSLVIDQRAFIADPGLTASADAAWSGLATPLEELLAVARLRARFEGEIDGKSEIVGLVKANLFSKNRKIAEALRSYAGWSSALLDSLQKWHTRIEEVPMREAAKHINANTDKFLAIAAHVEQLGLAAITVSFVTIRSEVDRQLKVSELQGKLRAHPVFEKIGAEVWLSPDGCQSIQRSGEISRAIAIASPDAAIRARLFSAGAAALRRSLRIHASGLIRAVAVYEAALARLSASIPPPANRNAKEPSSIANWLRPLIDDLPSLGEWLEVASRRSRLRSYGVDELVTAFEEAQLPAERLPKTFSALVFYHRATRAKQERVALRNMKGLDLENERARFVNADEELKKRQRDAVRAKLLTNAIPAGMSVGPKRDWTDLQCLRNEFTKQARHLPIRRLLLRAGGAVQAMKPCFMMSPLSLAKFLPSKAIKFDLLVIDEASQMKPEDSIGGLLRAKKVVVVGDPNQLPPSDFFARVTPVDEGGCTNDDEADDIDAESILDWSLKTFQTPRRLKWHYRSRCESLIAFSNKEFYSSKPGSHGDLITYPNARPGSFSVDLVRVNGSYKASRNPAEVARIVEAAIDFMMRHAHLPEEQIPTLGIVAVNIEQRDAIREEFNRCARDEAIERYLTACNNGTSRRGPESFFVKNLENVQGDERDFIMISLTYGREEGQERVAQRFGPIARAQGHRRLNVLFTRARQRIVLFASMGSDDVLVGPSTKRGVRVLRDYLRYVESRRLEVGVPTGRNFDSDFERDVQSRLEIRGFTVDVQVGVAGYRIDLGVRHPRNASVYLAGVECDGAAFHSARSARDRDRLREAVLRGKGWNILRVWSTDWFANADLQTDRLVAELERLAAHPIPSDTEWTIAGEPTTELEAARTTNEPQVIDGETALSSSSIVKQPANAISLDGKKQLTESELKLALRLLRDEIILKEFPGLDPARCILREIMISKIVESRLDEATDFTRKIPLWLRERTDHKQMSYLNQICSLVRRLQ